jgi:oxazoline/thiazoline synthase
MLIMLTDTMLNKPRLKQNFHVESVEGQGTFLLSEQTSIEVGNSWYELLLPLVDGQHTGEEIVSEALPHLLSEGASFEDAIQAGAHAFYALDQMAKQGYLMETDEQLPASLIAFCDALNIDSSVAHQRLQSTSVKIKAMGSTSMAALTSILQALHIQVVDVSASGRHNHRSREAQAASEGSIEIVLTDDYLQADLEAHNQSALETKRPWMLLKPSGLIAWIGPIFQPGKTACWDCLAHRLRGNRPVESFIERRKGTLTALPLTCLNSTTQTVLNMAATEIFKWIVCGQNQRLEGTLVTYDALAFKIDNHVLVKRPQCPSCGVVPNALGNSPIILGRRRKTFIADGGHRCATPEETLRAYQHHIGPITGVVRSIQKLSSAPMLHTYAARHHFAATYDDLALLRRNIMGRSAGKGKTDAQARASAFCEAIERYSGVFQGDEVKRKSSYQQLSDKAIHPNACMNFSTAQYKNRQSWNEHCSSFSQRVPEPFDPEKELEWTPIWSLTHQEFKYLPTAYCYHGYPQESQRSCWADSNGCAAGNSLEEAILQGFMELVERDSVALWWYNRTRHSAVDLDSFEDPYFQALRGYYQACQRNLWVLDITSDLNVPTFAAISRRTDGEAEDIVLGYGTHFDPAIAIGRALTEVNQILPAVLSANADGTTRYLSDDAFAIEWWKTATAINQPYLCPDKSLPMKTREDYPTIKNEDLLEDVKLCQQIVAERNMEMLVLDQTRPDVGLKVAKVVVPGLRHFWQRLGPGRLYEAPVQQGLLSTSIEESQLNPFPMWM